MRSVTGDTAYLVDGEGEKPSDVGNGEDERHPLLDMSERPVKRWIRALTQSLPLGPPPR